MKNNLTQSPTTVFFPSSIAHLFELVSLGLLLTASIIGVIYAGFQFALGMATKNVNMCIGILIGSAAILFLFLIVFGENPAKARSELN